MKGIGVSELKIDGYVVDLTDSSSILDKSISSYESDSLSDLSNHLNKLRPLTFEELQKYAKDGVAIV